MKVQLTSNLYKIDSTFANLLANQINVAEKIPVVREYPSTDYIIKKETIFSYISNAFVDNGDLYAIIDDEIQGSNKFTPVLNNDETTIIAVKHSTM
jgi:hypothetical protein